MPLKNKIAVVGYGYWGKNHARVLNSMNKLSGVYDLSEEKLNNAKKNKINVFNSLEDLIENSSAAIIATPAQTHFKISNYLIDSLDLLVEKPLGLSVKECDELISKSKKNKKILMVGHQLHFHNGIKKMYELIDKNKIGKIKWIYSNRLNMGKVRNEENVLWSFAPHDISLLLKLANSKIKKLNVQGTTLFNNNVEDATLTSFEFNNGVKAHIFVSWFHPFKEQRFVVVGEKGTIVFSDSNQKNKLVLYLTKLSTNPLEIKEHIEKEIVYKDIEPLLSQTKYFINSIKTRNVEINTAKEAREVIKVLEDSSKLLR